MQYRNQIQYTALNARNQQARKDTETINAQKKEIEQLKLMDKRTKRRPEQRSKRPLFTKY